MSKVNEARESIFKFLMRKIGIWVAVLAFFLGLLLHVIFGGNEDHQSGLAFFVFGLPVLALQVLLVGIVALAVEFVLGEIRSTEWYDRNGAAVQMQKIRARVGTPKEKPNDGMACSRQFLARNIIIAAILIGFFLLKSS